MASSEPGPVLLKCSITIRQKNDSTVTGLSVAPQSYHNDPKGKVSPVTDTLSYMTNTCVITHTQGLPAILPPPCPRVSATSQASLSAFKFFYASSLTELGRRNTICSIQNHPSAPEGSKAVHISSCLSTSMNRWPKVLWNHRAWLSWAPWGQK